MTSGSRSSCGFDPSAPGAYASITFVPSASVEVWTVSRSMTSPVRYDATGRLSVHPNVRRPARVTGGSGAPLPTTVQPVSGTVVEVWNVALADGRSSTGYQLDAECGSPYACTAPSSLAVIHQKPGVPAYRTRTANRVPPV